MPASYKLGAKLQEAPSLSLTIYVMRLAALDRSSAVFMESRHTLQLRAMPSHLSCTTPATVASGTTSMPPKAFAQNLILSNIPPEMNSATFRASPSATFIGDDGDARSAQRSRSTSGTMTRKRCSVPDFMYIS